MKSQRLSPKPQPKPKSNSKLIKYGFGFGIAALCSWGGLALRYSAPEGFYSSETGITLATGDSLDAYQFADEQKVYAQKGITSSKDMLLVDANHQYLQLKNTLSFIKEKPNYLQNGYAPIYGYVENKNAELKYSFYKTGVSTETLEKIQNFTDSIAKNKNLIPVNVVLAPIQKPAAGWQDQTIYARFQMNTDLKHDAALLIYLGTLQNQTMAETKFVLAHEMRHLITLQSEIKAQKYNPKPTRSQQMDNETDADLNALEITHDPDAAIRALGKFNRSTNNTHTLLGWFAEDIRNKFGSDNSAHPITLDRARAVQKWKDQHLQNN